MTDFLKAKWENLVMANYSVPPALLLPYLPKGVELDLFQGEAIVSLVGFLFKDTRIFNVPIPFFGTFEEINLRFYVVRNEGYEQKRGVVFINETVPSKVVALVANYLYKEHYVSIPTRHHWEISQKVRKIEYEWKVGTEWNRIYAEASPVFGTMKQGSIEEFIFEHYFGYTKIDANSSEEYNVRHPRWKINEVTTYKVACNFGAMYGNDFAFLQNVKPGSVLLAEGSSVSVKWKRNRF